MMQRSRTRSLIKEISAKLKAGEGFGIHLVGAHLKERTMLIRGYDYTKDSTLC